MSDEHLLSRREFNVEWALAVLGAATITISGCGDDDSGPTNPSSQPGDEVGAISGNHGHEITLRAAEVSAGAALMSLDIRGSATHPHSIDLTAAQVMAIGQNQRVSVTSTTNDGHTHTVTFN
jgi:VCBS repeat-containing protein